MKQNLNQIKIVELGQVQWKDDVLEEAGCTFVEPCDFDYSNLWTYTFDPAPFDRTLIDQKLTLVKVQNRINGKINTDAVQKYEVCIEAGDILPGLVLFQDSDGNTLNGDGIHTNAALEKLNVSMISGVYKFSHPDPLSVVPKFNVKTGIGEPINETLEKATRSFVREVEKCKAEGVQPPTQKDWAKSFRLTERQFNVYLQRNETKRRLAELGVNVQKIEHDTSFEALSSIMKVDESAAATIANIAVKYSLPSGRVTEVCKDWKDPSKNVAAKEFFLEDTEVQLKKKTVNCTRKLSNLRQKNRSPEMIFKDDSISLNELLKRANISQIKNMLGDQNFKTAIENLSKVFKVLLK